jgi:hypothetical protein
MSLAQNQRQYPESLEVYNGIGLGVRDPELNQIRQPKTHFSDPKSVRQPRRQTGMKIREPQNKHRIPQNLTENTRPRQPQVERRVRQGRKI